MVEMYTKVRAVIKLKKKFQRLSRLKGIEK